MIDAFHKSKVEYGDFQTPLKLAEEVCQKLLELGVNPNVIIEPTCGVGNFIEASIKYFPKINQVIGVEINPEYIKTNNKYFIKDKQIQITCDDFFKIDWSFILKNIKGELLVLGNFPWVTNSQQGLINGINLPKKINFKNYSGLDAVTGKSNFDISEWMLIQVAQWLQNREAYLAMLCKTSVTRKLLSYLRSENLNLSYCATYKIDAKKYFGTTVESCLLFCQFNSGSKNYFCDVFSSLKSSTCYRIGYYQNTLVRDVNSFNKLSSFYDKKTLNKWRSGIKHDCSSIMEFRKISNHFVNGLGEVVDLEETYLFPFSKGSDVAQNRTKLSNRYLLVTQKFVGESTDRIKDLAPKTWSYLEYYESYLAKRKSRIYLNKPRFSIFGVGSYTFAPFKIAICGLYKKLDFRFVEEKASKPVVFDDTVYFLSFQDEQLAYKTFELLTSTSAIAFYSSLIFWDEKRPIKSSILNSLNITALARIEEQQGANNF